MLSNTLLLMNMLSQHTQVYTRTPLTPLRSRSSMNNDRYSGDFVFKLMKYSKSDDIICLNSLSLLKDSCRKWSKRSFKSKRLCCHTYRHTHKHTDTTVITCFLNVNWFRAADLRKTCHFKDAHPTTHDSPCTNDRRTKHQHIWQKTTPQLKYKEC